MSICLGWSSSSGKLERGKRTPKTTRFMVTGSCCCCGCLPVACQQCFVGAFPWKLQLRWGPVRSVLVGKIIHFDCTAMGFVKANSRTEPEQSLDYLSINYRLWFVCQGAAASCRATDTPSIICTPVNSSSSCGLSVTPLPLPLHSKKGEGWASLNTAEQTVSVYQSVPMKVAHPFVSIISGR